MSIYLFPYTPNGGLNQKHNFLSDFRNYKNITTVKWDNEMLGTINVYGVNCLRSHPIN